MTRRTFEEWADSYDHESDEWHAITIEDAWNAALASLEGVCDNCGGTGFMRPDVSMFVCLKCDGSGLSHPVSAGFEEWWKLERSEVRRVSWHPNPANRDTALARAAYAHASAANRAEIEGLRREVERLTRENVAAAEGIKTWSDAVENMKGDWARGKDEGYKQGLADGRRFPNG